MARMDVHRAPDGAQGYVVEVQPDALAPLPTRVVVPLVPLEGGPPLVADLNPVFAIEGVDYVLLPQFIGVLPAAALAEPIGDLTPHRDLIVHALDRLLVEH